MEKAISHNPEKRVYARFTQESPIVHEQYNTGNYYGARMYNYSRGGMYFESDVALQPGTDLYIGIEDSPYAHMPDIYEGFRAVVRWCSQVRRQNAMYGYGIGVKYLNPVR